MENREIITIINNKKNKLLINFNEFTSEQLFYLSAEEIINLNNKDEKNSYLIWINTNELNNLLNFLEKNKSFYKKKFVKEIKEFLFNDENISKYEEAKKIKNELSNKKIIDKNTDEKILNRYEDFKKNLKEKLKKFIFNEENEKNTEKQMQNVFQSTILKNSANFSEPGSGKTLMSIMTHLERERQFKKKLKMIIICPIVAFDVWKSEILNFTNLEYNDIHIYDENYKEENETDYIDDIKYSKVIILNYEKMKQFSNNKTRKENLFSIESHLIIDEIHRIKNPNGKTSDIIRKLVETENIKYTTILTGTPSSNNIYELINILNIAWKKNIPNLPNTLIDEMNRIFTNIKKNEDLTNEDKNLINKFNNIINPIYILLKKKEDFNILNAKDLFNKPITVKPTNEQLEKDEILYNSLMNQTHIFKNNKNKNKKENLEKIFRILGSLRKNASGGFEENLNEEKVNKIYNLVSNILKNDNEKIIIWFEFKEPMDYFKKFLKEKNIDSEIIHGDIDVIERRNILNNFRDPNKFKILITNAATIGESISLHNIVKNAIFAEMTTSYFRWVQAKDRIHRVGIKDGSKVTYYYLKNEKLNSDRIVWDNLAHKEKMKKLLFDNKNLINPDFIKINEDNIESSFKTSEDNEDIFILKK
ncbi:MAG: DNA helicase [Candidatus Hepatoplasma vulgare]|nr:MAG: DNA helicase [Candidatus Hepatoplasma sp.]